MSFDQTHKYVLLTGFILIFSHSLLGQIYDSPAYQKKRIIMIEDQIKARGVKNPDVLRAMEEVPRHLFVSEDLKHVAYTDGPLPIGHGQTISQPYIVALMTELLEPDSQHMVLEVGTGSGYQAAVLSKLAKHVYTIEIIPELGQEAEKRLKQMGYDNISVKIGDGYKGWPEKAPFDRIIITAAPEQIPEKLVEQLKPGGQMILPVGPQLWGQDLIVLEKNEQGEISTKKSIPVRFVPMVHEKE